MRRWSRGCGRCCASRRCTTRCRSRRHRLEAQAAELAAWNRELETRVQAQLARNRAHGPLKRFLAPQLAETDRGARRRAHPRKPSPRHRRRVLRPARLHRLLRDRRARGSHRRCCANITARWVRCHTFGGHPRPFLGRRHHGVLQRPAALSGPGRARRRDGGRDARGGRRSAGRTGGGAAARSASGSASRRATRRWARSASPSGSTTPRSARSAISRHGSALPPRTARSSSAAASRPRSKEQCPWNISATSPSRG